MALTLEYMERQIEKITEIAAQTYELAIKAEAEILHSEGSPTLEGRQHVFDLFKEAANLFSLAANTTAAYLVTKWEGENKSPDPL